MDSRRTRTLSVGSLRRGGKGTLQQLSYSTSALPACLTNSVIRSGVIGSREQSNSNSKPLSQQEADEAQAAQPDFPQDAQPKAKMSRSPPRRRLSSIGSSSSLGEIDRGKSIENLLPYVSDVAVRRVLADVEYARHLRLIERVGTHARLPTKHPSIPSRDKMSAVVFFLDCSGFTRITEVYASGDEGTDAHDDPVSSTRMAAAGEGGGAEAVRDVLCSYFTEVLDLIESHGGDVVKFAGDALLCIFPLSDRIFRQKYALSALSSPGQSDTERVMSPASSYNELDREGMTSSPLNSLDGFSFTSAVISHDMNTWTDTIKRATMAAFRAATNITRDFEESGGFRLTCRVVLTLGEVDVMHVGTDERVEVVLAGHPLSEMAHLMKAASPQTVVVSRTMAEELGGVATIERDRRHKCHMVVGLKEEPSFPAAMSLDDSPSHLLRQRVRAIPQEDLKETERLLMRFFPTTLNLHAEMRTVGTVFVNLIGVPPDHPELLDKLQTATTEAIRICRENGGSLRQTIVDDKGAVLIPIFGLPSRQTSGQVQQEARAAVHLCTSLRRSGISCSLGLTVGRVFVGDVGSSRRRELAVVGTAVNKAARLAAKAYTRVKRGLPILADQPAKENASNSGQAFDETAVPPLRLKGFQEPVKVFVPCWSSELAALAVRATVGVASFLKRTAACAGDSTQHLFGRDQVLRDIRDAIKSTHAVTLTGPSGIGRTSLLRALAQEMQIKWETDEVSAAFVAVQADVSRKHLPYGLLQDIFSALLPGSPEQRTDQAFELLFESENASELLDFASLLRAVGIPIEPRAVAESADAQLRARSLRKLVVTLLRSLVARQPLVLFVDDYEHADANSAIVIAAAVKVLASKGLTTVVAVRSDSAVVDDDEMQLIAALHIGRVMPVKPLNAAAVAKVVLHGVNIPETSSARLEDGTLQVLMEKTQGNALFATELASLLRQKSLLIESAPKVFKLATHADALSLPMTVERLLVAKVDALPPLTRATLKVASVLGSKFHAGDLVELLRNVVESEQDEDFSDLLSADDITDALAAPEAASFAILVDPRSNEYHFNHEFGRQALYEMLASSLRRSLHKEIALRYETEAGGIVAREQPEMLADHWRRAGYPEHALAYTEEAAEQAWRANQPGAVIELLEKMVQTVADDGVPCDANRLSRVLGLLGSAQLKAWSDYDRTVARTEDPLEKSIKVLDHFSKIGFSDKRLNEIESVPDETERVQQAYDVATRIFFALSNTVLNYDPSSVDSDEHRTLVRLTDTCYLYVWRRLMPQMMTSTDPRDENFRNACSINSAPKTLRAILGCAVAAAKSGKWSVLIEILGTLDPVLSTAAFHGLRLDEYSRARNELLGRVQHQCSLLRTNLSEDEEDGMDELDADRLTPMDEAMASKHRILLCCSGRSRQILEEHVAEKSAESARVLESYHKYEEASDLYVIEAWSNFLNSRFTAAHHAGGSAERCAAHVRNEQTRETGIRLQALAAFYESKPRELGLAQSRLLQLSPAVRNKYWGGLELLIFVDDLRSCTGQVGNPSVHGCLLRTLNQLVEHEAVPQLWTSGYARATIFSLPFCLALDEVYDFAMCSPVTSSERKLMKKLTALMEARVAFSDRLASVMQGEYARGAYLLGHGLMLLHQDGSAQEATDAFRDCVRECSECCPQLEGQALLYIAKTNQDVRAAQDAVTIFRSIGSKHAERLATDLLVLTVQRSHSYPMRSLSDTSGDDMMLDNRVPRRSRSEFPPLFFESREEPQGEDRDKTDSGSGSGSGSSGGWMGRRSRDQQDETKQPMCRRRTLSDATTITPATQDTSATTDYSAERRYSQTTGGTSASSFHGEGGHPSFPSTAFEPQNNAAVDLTPVTQTVFPPAGPAAPVHAQTGAPQHFVTPPFMPQQHQQLQPQFAPQPQPQLQPQFAPQPQFALQPHLQPQLHAQHQAHQPPSRAASLPMFKHAIATETEAERWLRSNGIDPERFSEEGLTTVNQLRRLTPDMLTELGVIRMADRMKFEDLRSEVRWWQWPSGGSNALFLSAVAGGAAALAVAVTVSRLLHSHPRNSRK